MWKLFAGMLMLIWSAGCGGSTSEVKSTDRTDSAGQTTSRSTDGQTRLRAAATIGMVADLVRNVGGEHVDVVQIMGSTVDPHLYKATRDDVQTIMSRNIVFYSGLMLEGKMTDTLVRVGRNKPVYAVTEMIDASQLLEPDDFRGHYDPHVWMDASAWSKCLDVVSRALSEADAAHADSYRSRAEVYRQQLVELHEYGKRSIATIPESSRVLITSHDAFNYFGRAYGLDVQGVQGLSTESEAGLQRVNELVDLIVSRNVQAVFVESSVPEKSINSLLEGARAKGHSVRIGGTLFSDAMGEAGTYEGTYVGMLDHNITLVTRALGGTAPESGLHGRLSKAGGSSE